MQSKVFWLLTLLLISLTGFAGDPEDPSAVEIANFRAKLDRLNAHPEKQPVSVSEAIQSLEETITKRIKCPEGLSVDSLIINITTRHVQWDRDLAVNGLDPVIEDNAIGYYLWTFLSGTDERKKTVNFTNYVMLDPNVTDPQENDPLIGPLLDETLLYHELLHGQLMINAMQTPEWIDTVCKCHMDLSAADEEHTQIYDLAAQYLDSISGDNRQINVIHPDPTVAEPNGNFSIPLIDGRELGKTDWSWNVVFSDGANIHQASFNLVVIDNVITATGRLLDPSKVGHVLIYIDPPEIYYVWGIEGGHLILPSESPLPPDHTPDEAGDEEEPSYFFIYIIPGIFLLLLFVFLLLRSRSRKS